MSLKKGPPRLKDLQAYNKLVQENKSNDVALININASRLPRIFLHVAGCCIQGVMTEDNELEKWATIDCLS